MIVFLTRDLMIQSSAAAAARIQGVSLVAVPTMDRAIEKLVGTQVLALFVDLQTPGLKFDELIMRLAASPCRPRVIAFAQHVETELLELAKTNVIDQVLTRGQFNSRLPMLIKQALTTAAAGNSVSDAE